MQKKSTKEQQDFKNNITGMNSTENEIENMNIDNINVGQIDDIDDVQLLLDLDKDEIDDEDIDNFDADININSSIDKTLTPMDDYDIHTDMKDETIANGDEVMENNIDNEVNHQQEEIFVDDSHNFINTEELVKLKQNNKNLQLDLDIINKEKNDLYNKVVKQKKYIKKILFISITSIIILIGGFSLYSKNILTGHNENIISEIINVNNSYTVSEQSIINYIALYLNGDISKKEAVLYISSIPIVEEDNISKNINEDLNAIFNEKNKELNKLLSSFVSDDANTIKNSLQNYIDTNNQLDSEKIQIINNISDSLGYDVTKDNTGIIHIK